MFSKVNYNFEISIRSTWKDKHIFDVVPNALQKKQSNRDIDEKKLDLFFIQNQSGKNTFNAHVPLPNPSRFCVKTPEFSKST